MLHIEDDTVRQALLVVREVLQEIDDFIAGNPEAPGRLKMAMENQRACIYKLVSKLETAVRER